MAKRVKALITPEVLLWARENAGYSIEEAAKSALVKPAQVMAWEKGEARPTINQLRRLANKYKRPVAVFYLPEPPKDFQALRDFRRLPGDVAGKESPALRLAIRWTQYRRDVALELLRELGEEPPEFGVTGSLEEDPEALANRLRSALKASANEQANWRQEYSILGGWRRLLERAGVLVFQFSGVEVEEARGFSISDQPLPVVAVNVRDSPRGRVFSMLHELSHVSLRTGGLCDFKESAERPPEEQRIEVFCNHVAGAVLVPGEELLADQVVLQHGHDPRWTNEELEDLSRRFGASREAVLRRLLIVGRTSRAEYLRSRRRFLQEYQQRRENQSGAPPQDRLVISRVGSLFAGLVLAGYDQDKITASRVSDYLGVKLKHLAAIREDLAESAAGVG